MKMINKILIVCILTCTTYFTQAQNDMTTNDSEGFYFRVSTGYSFESGKTEFNNADPNDLTGITQSTDITAGADGSVNVKSLTGTAGAGLKVNLTAGYMFNPYVGAELGVSYFHGDKTMIGRFETPFSLSEENTYLRGVDVSPGIFLTPNFKTVNPYARMGLIIPVAGKLTIETMAQAPDDIQAPTKNLLIEAKSEVSARFSVGYFGALGISYPVSENISIFGEVEIKNLSIKSKSAEIIEYSTTDITGGGSQLVPGQQLADLPMNQKKFEFSDEYDEAKNQNPNEAKKIPTQFVNASGTGINVGIRFTL